MELLILVILFVGGVFTELYASSVGGGVLITFPLLILSGLSTLAAIATHRLSIVLLEFSSAAMFYKKKKPDMRLGVFLGIVAAAGSFIGSNIVIKINEKYLNLIVAVMFFMIVLVLYHKDKLGIKEKKVTHTNLGIAAVFTFFLGIYGGFFGGGFGTFIMFLLLMLGFTFIESAATGRVIGFMMSSAAALVFALNGLINYPYALSLGFGCAVGSFLGVNIAVKKGNRVIRMMFIAIIILTIIKLLLGFFGISLF